MKCTGEYKQILKISEINGETTTLSSINMNVTYKNLLTIIKHLRILTKCSNTTIVLTPQNTNSMKNILNSNMKDHILPEKKSGIYQIFCRDFEKLYIGNTNRNLQTREKEYFRNKIKGEIEKSAIIIINIKYAAC